jgi:hypothetical protein
MGFACVERALPSTGNIFGWILRRGLGTHLNNMCEPQNNRQREHSYPNYALQQLSHYACFRPQPSVHLGISLFEF